MVQWRHGAGLARGQAYAERHIRFGVPPSPCVFLPLGEAQ